MWVGSRRRTREDWGRGVSSEGAPRSYTGCGLNEVERPRLGWMLCIPSLFPAMREPARPCHRQEKIEMGSFEPMEAVTQGGGDGEISGGRVLGNVCALGGGGAARGIEEAS